MLCMVNTLLPSFRCLLFTKPRRSQNIQAEHLRVFNMGPSKALSTNFLFNTYAAVPLPMSPGVVQPELIKGGAQHVFTSRHGGTVKMRFALLPSSSSRRLVICLSCLATASNLTMSLWCFDAQGHSHSHFLLFLLVCGDIESNPGPITSESADTIAEVLQTVKDLNVRPVRMETVENAVSGDE